MNFTIYRISIQNRDNNNNEETFRYQPPNYAFFRGLFPYLENTTIA